MNGIEYLVVETPPPQSERKLRTANEIRANLAAAKRRWRLRKKLRAQAAQGASVESPPAEAPHE